ncbi:unnamed protein product [Calypogeia fissa]
MVSILQIFGLDLRLAQQLETWRMREEQRMAPSWAPTFIKCAASEYVLFLIRDQQPRQGMIEGSNASSSSCHYPKFFSLMAREIGISMKDTARLCSHLISAGNGTAARGDPQAHDKTILYMKVYLCRKIFEKFPGLATTLPNQEALFVQAKILDEFF